MAKAPLVAGIDIGSSKITTIITSLSEDQSRVNVVGVASVESRGIRKSQVVDIEEAIEAITKSVESAERMAGYSISDAYVSVSGDHIQSQNSKGVVAVGNPEGEIVQDDVYRVIEAARAVSLPSSREILHVLPREFVVDSQTGVRDPLGMTGVRLEAEAHIVTGSSAVLRNLTKCIAEIGVNVNGLVFSGLASAEATLSDTEKELGVVLIDIGGGTTSIAVYIEGSLSHSAVIPVGAKNITNDLAIGLRISLDSAEKIKQHLTELERQKPKEDSDPKKHDELNLARLGLKEEIKQTSKKTLVEGIIRPRLNEIFAMVGEQLKKSGFANTTPAGVVITGGGAETVEVLSSAKRVLQLPARIGSPKGLTGLIDEIGSPAFSTATGLILYARSQNAATPSSKLSFPMLKNLPGKGLVNKGMGWIKSLLP